MRSGNCHEDNAVCSGCNERAQCVSHKQVCCSHPARGTYYDQVTAFALANGYLAWSVVASMPAIVGMRFTTSELSHS